MKRVTVLLMAIAVLGAGEAYGQSQSGPTRQPGRAIGERVARTSAKLDRRSLKGRVLARGKRVERNRDGIVQPECEFNYSFETELFSGNREVTIQHTPDCRAVLEKIEDMNAVEPQEGLIAGVSPGAFGSASRVVGKLWEALFPTVLAQTWNYRTLYHHIYTCGVACHGSVDGLTALQGWLDYRYNGSTVVNEGAAGWMCVAGQHPSYPNRSNCQPPMEVAYSPMAPVNTGWWGYNFWITGRIWGPGGIVLGQDQSSYYWLPLRVQPGPRFYEHTLYNQRTARANGVASCGSSVTGSFVNGPVRSLCVVRSRTGA
jgi:hypothetical protein